MADPHKARRGSGQSIKLAAHHREKIRLGELLTRLEKNALGELKAPSTGEPFEMTPGQIQSAIAVLRKVMPDLTNQSVDLSGEVKVSQITRRIVDASND